FDRQAFVDEGFMVFSQGEKRGFSVFAGVWKPLLAILMLLGGHYWRFSKCSGGGKGAPCEFFIGCVSALAFAFISFVLRPLAVREPALLVGNSLQAQRPRGEIE